jgi:hypothetical protein
MQLLVEIPDSVNIPRLDPAYLKQALVATLYHVGKLSEREACLILGMTRRDFEELLPKFGFSILGDDQFNLNLELNA